MDNKERILKAEELLKVNKQENVLNFFKKLSEDKQIKLAEKIINLNFEQLNKLYAETKETPEISEKRLHILNMLTNINCLMKTKKNIQNLEKI